MERERRLEEVAMLERHIMQAQARAMSSDERALNRMVSSHNKFPDLGLPPCGLLLHFKLNLQAHGIKPRVHQRIVPLGMCDMCR